MLSVNTRKILALVISFALSAVVTFPSYAAAITVTDTVTEPYEATIEACNGEDVHLSGELLFISHITVDASGAIHSAFILVPQDVVGVGAETGVQYRAVGGDREQFYNLDADVGPITYTNTDMYNLVSQGGSDNLQVKYTFHATVNANGELTVEFDHFSAKCVG